MSRKSIALLIASGLVALTLWNPLSGAERKEANLTKKSGPWMIMVCSLTVYNTDAGVGPEFEKIAREQRENGEKAAHNLVAELEKKGIPAFFFHRGEEIEEVRTRDRLGNVRTRKIQSQHDQMCVLAGNFETYDDPKAQKLLKQIKAMKPKALENGQYQATSKDHGPLAGAFMTINPLLSPEDIADMERKRDPLLKRLNSGSEFSLVKNPGEYTLVVASFYGKSQGVAMSAGKEEFDRKSAAFDKKLQSGVSLDQAGYDAWSMAKIMRSHNQEAYVYHDRDRSIVTVGSFEKADDPRLLKLAQSLKAKFKTDPKSGKQSLVCEMVTVPGANPNQPPEKLWLIDPEPKPMRVPRLK